MAGLLPLGARRVRVELTCLDDRMAPVSAAVAEALAADPDAETGGAEAGGAEAGGVVEVADAPQRQSGRGYYTGLCFKVYAAFGGPELEVGDGGFVDWTQKLLDSRKERLLISGYGIDRIAIASL